MKHMKSILGLFAFAVAVFAAVSVTKTTAAVKSSATYADYVWIKYDCNNAEQVQLVTSGQNFQETDGALSYTGVFESCPGEFNLCAVKFPIAQTTLSPDGKNRIPNISPEGLERVLCTLPPQ